MNVFASEALNQDVQRQMETYLHGGTSLSGFNIFACASDCEYVKYLSALQNQSQNMVIGGTTIASPFQTVDDTLSLQLAFIDKPGLLHSAALSEPITPDTDRDDMRAFFNKCLAGFPGKPKMLLLVIPVVPYMFIDHFIDAIFEFADDIPVFGGMVADEFNQGQGMVFFGTQAYRDRMILVALGGAIEPVFGAGYEITTPSSYSPIVTKAADNVVLMVDGFSVAEYLAKVGFDPASIAPTLDDWPLPVWIRHPDGLPNSAARVNSLVKLLPDGSGVFSSNVPVGSSIRMAFLTLANVANSAEKAVKSLVEAMRAKERGGYVFRQILAISSLARYYVMSGGEPVEANILAENLSHIKAKFGVYGLSEICPMSNEPGQPDSRRHIQTLALCAL